MAGLGSEPQAAGPTSCAELLHTVVSQETAKWVATVTANVCQALAAAFAQSPEVGAIISILQMGKLRPSKVN